MIKYTETVTYKNHLAELDANIKRLEATIADLSCIRLNGGTVRRKRTPDENRKLLNDKNRIKTYRKKLQRWYDLNVTSWDIVHLIQDADGRLWNSNKQEELWHKGLASHEGRGEAALRDWYGLTTAGSTTDDIDIPELEVEVKNVQGRAKNGTFQLQTIQAGKSGRQAYSTWMGETAEAGSFKELSHNVRLALFTGEVTSGIIYKALPESTRISLLDAIKPSTVFSRPRAVDCTTRNGCLHVERYDYDVAFAVVSVTKCGPKYALKRSYLLDRLKRTLSATKDATDEAA